MDTASGPTPRGIDFEEWRGTTRQRRHARNLLELTTLYSTRDDIRGVSRVADFFADSVRWSV